MLSIDMKVDTESQKDDIGSIIYLFQREERKLIKL